jgi:uncharacterized protein YjbJ (UPF0337 family)
MRFFKRKVCGKRGEKVENTKNPVKRRVEKPENRRAFPGALN